MTATTHTTLSGTRPVLPVPALPRFRPGDLVVIARPRPVICVVVTRPQAGFIRLGHAACPEVHVQAGVSDVQHLSAWLAAQLAGAGRPRSPGAGGAQWT